MIDRYLTKLQNGLFAVGSPYINNMKCILKRISIAGRKEVVERQDEPSDEQTLVTPTFSANELQNGRT